jgi:hypothetical protein
VAACGILAHVYLLDERFAALTAQIDARAAAFAPVYKLLLPVPVLTGSASTSSRPKPART